MRSACSVEDVHTDDKKKLEKILQGPEMVSRYFIANRCPARRRKRVGPLATSSHWGEDKKKKGCSGCDVCSWAGVCGGGGE